MELDEFRSNEIAGLCAQAELRSPSAVVSATAPRGPALTAIF